MADNGTVSVTLNLRLWASVPEHLRVTEEDVRAKYDHPLWATFVVDRWLKRLSQPTCDIAIEVAEFKGKWAPCAGQGYEAGRCKRHGGPGRPGPTSAPVTRLRLAERLIAEIEELVDDDAIRERIWQYRDHVKEMGL